MLPFKDVPEAERDDGVTERYRSLYSCTNSSRFFRVQVNMLWWRPRHSSITNGIVNKLDLQQVATTRLVCSHVQQVTFVTNVRTILKNPICPKGFGLTTYPSANLFGYAPEEQLSFLRLGSGVAVHAFGSRRMPDLFVDLDKLGSVSWTFEPVGTGVQHIRQNRDFQAQGMAASCVKSFVS